MTEIHVSGFFNKVINKIRQFIKKVRNCLEFGVQELDREVWISIYQYILVCSYTAALFYMEPGCIVLTEEFRKRN